MARKKCHNSTESTKNSLQNSLTFWSSTNKKFNLKSVAVAGKTTMADINKFDWIVRTTVVRFDWVQRMNAIVMCANKNEDTLTSKRNNIWHGGALVCYFETLHRNGIEPKRTRSTRRFENSIRFSNLRHNLHPYRLQTKKKRHLNFYFDFSMKFASFFVLLQLNLVDLYFYSIT